MRLILSNQALGHPKMRFLGSRLTEFPFMQPPPPPLERSQIGVFSPRQPGMALRSLNLLFLGVLNSIMSLILINQALEHLKVRF